MHQMGQLPRLGSQLKQLFLELLRIQGFILHLHSGVGSQDTLINIFVQRQDQGSLIFFSIGRRNNLMVVLHL